MRQDAPDPIDHEMSHDPEEVSEPIESEHVAPKEPFVEKDAVIPAEAVEEVKARLRGHAEELDTGVAAAERAPAMAEGHESIEGKIEKLHAPREKTKPKYEKKHTTKDHSEKHGKEDHGGGHHGPSKLDVIKGVAIGTVGAGLLAAGALGESISIANLAGVSPLVHGTLVALGLGSAGFFVVGLASLVALNFFGNFAISLWESLKANPPWKGIFKGGSSGGGGGGGAKSHGH